MMSVPHLRGHNIFVFVQVSQKYEVISYASAHCDISLNLFAIYLQN